MRSAFEGRAGTDIAMLRKTIFVILLFGVGALGLGAPGFLSEWPGGVRPSYDARDDDPRLTVIAAEALPIIDALERYHEAHQAYPGADDAAALLPPEIAGWSYLRGDDASSYSLSRKLGWDTALAFRRDAKGSQWVFQPGDGSDDVPIILHPDKRAASR
jgi:hypothetical protein